MYLLSKLFHLAGAIVWLGGMTFVLWSLRPALHEELAPPQRLPLLARTLARFFVLVWASIAVLLVSGGLLFANAGALAVPVGWHVMAGVGTLMCLIFAHIYFAPFRRLKAAVTVADWPEGGRRAGQIAKLVTVNFWLGWLAIAAVLLLS